MIGAGMNDCIRKPFRPAEIFECMGRLLGVRYDYSDADETGAPPPPAALTRQALADLPNSLRGLLIEALLTLEPSRISIAVEMVAEHDPTLGRLLREQAESLAYTRILNALRQ